MGLPARRCRTGWRTWSVRGVPTVRARCCELAPDRASERRRLQNGRSGGQYPEGPPYFTFRGGGESRRSCKAEHAGKQPRPRIHSSLEEQERRMSFVAMAKKDQSGFVALGFKLRTARHILERAWCKRSTSVIHTEGGGALPPARPSFISGISSKAERRPAKSRTSERYRDAAPFALRGVPATVF